MYIITHNLVIRSQRKHFWFFCIQWILNQVLTDINYLTVWTPLSKQIAWHSKLIFCLNCCLLTVLFYIQANTNCWKLRTRIRGKGKEKTCEEVGREKEWNWARYPFPFSLIFSRSHVPLSGSLIFLIFSSVKSRGRGGYVLGGNNSVFIQVKRRPRNLCYPSLLKWQ